MFYVKNVGRRRRESNNVGWKICMTINEKALTCVHNKSFSLIGSFCLLFKLNGLIKLPLRN